MTAPYQRIEQAAIEIVRVVKHEGATVADVIHLLRVLVLALKRDKGEKQ